MKLLLFLSILLMCQFKSSYAVNLNEHGKLLLDQFNTLQTIEEDYTYQVGPTDDLKNKLEPWRIKLIEWAYEVIDHFEMDRNIVSLSFKLFDRYAVLKGVSTRTEAKHLSMSALYLAIKVSDAPAITPLTFSKLSRNTYQPEQIEEMERKLLSSLDYRIHPPLESDYLAGLRLLLIEIDIHSRLHVIEIVRYLVEISIHDSYFIGKPASYVAFAALEATLVHELNEGRLTHDDYSQFSAEASKLFNFDQNLDDTKARKNADKRKRMTDRFGSLLAKIKDALPRAKVDMWKFGSKYDPKNLSEDTECPICLEKFEDEDKLGLRRTCNLSSQLNCKSYI